MTNLPEPFAEVLSEYDHKGVPFDEHDIYSALSSLKEQESIKSLSTPLRAEMMAFRFMEDWSEKEISEFVEKAKKNKRPLNVTPKQATLF